MTKQLFYIALSIAVLVAILLLASHDTPWLCAFSCVAFALAIHLATTLYGLRVRFSDMFDSHSSAGQIAPAPSFHSYLLYKFAHWAVWTPGSEMVILLSICIAVVLVGGILGRLLTDVDLDRALWFAWSQLISPDGGAQATGAKERIIGMLSSLCGLLVFALFVSMISERFQQILLSLKDGRFNVVESGHIIICGWNAIGPMLVEELATAAEQDGGVAVVVLADMPKASIEKSIRETNMSLKDSFVCVRQGCPASHQSLRSVYAETARSIILLSDTEKDREERDAQTVRQLLSLRSLPHKSSRKIVAQCCLVANQRMLKNFASDQCEIVVVDSYLGRLMVQFSRKHGIASVFEELLGFEGAEIYIHQLPLATGRTWRDVSFSIINAVAIGIMRDGRTCEFLPTSDRIIEEGEEIILIADNGRAPHIADKLQVDHETACTDVPKKASSEPTVRRPKDLPKRSMSELRRGTYRFTFQTKRQEAMIIVGWNSLAGSLLMELSQILTSDSVLTIYSPVPTSQRENFLADYCERTGASIGFQLNHTEGKLGDLFRMKSLPFEGSQAIFVLADDTASTALDCDSKMLSALVILQHILLDLKLPEHPPIIPETQLKESDAMCLAAGCLDYLGSQRLMSRVLAAVCWNPRMNYVFNHLMCAKEVLFTIVPILPYITYRENLSQEEKQALLPSEISFYEILALAHINNEIAIGWTKPGAIEKGTVAWNRKLRAQQARQKGLENLHISGLNGCWEINPADKNQKRKWDLWDRIIVLSTEYVQN